MNQQTCAFLLSGMFDRHLCMFTTISTSHTICPCEPLRCLTRQQTALHPVNLDLTRHNDLPCPALSCPVLITCPLFTLSQCTTGLRLVWKYDKKKRYVSYKWWKSRSLYLQNTQIRQHLYQSFFYIRSSQQFWIFYIYHFFWDGIAIPLGFCEIVWYLVSRCFSTCGICITFVLVIKISKKLCSQQQKCMLTLHLNFDVASLSNYYY